VAAQHLIAIDEVLGSWQGDDTVQFIELRMLAPGQQFLSDGGGSRGASDLIFDDASGSAATRRSFVFTHDVGPNALQDSRILIATSGLATIAGVTPDFVLPPGMLAPHDGRVCYRVNPPQANATGVIDCVAYGNFTGDVGPFGPPTPLTPDNRSLQRIGFSGSTVADWGTTLGPTPTNDAGGSATLQTLCGDGLLSQGEQCDGQAFGGNTCASLGFATGTLACNQCHFDTSGCSFCGNGVINGKEQCDGADLGGRTCESLGFTGGALACTARCRLSTKTCDPTFFVPGGGTGPECLAEWQVTNAAGRPGPDGKAPIRQRCRDGDAGCDADPTPGVCGFTVAVCFDHNDARFVRDGVSCRRPPVETWTLLAPATGAEALVTAVGQLGPSSTGAGTVTFAPPLDATEHCTGPVQLAVPTRGHRAGSLVLRTRTAGAGGRPRDSDALKLVCVP
jgi:hypothetical protein